MPQFRVKGNERLVVQRVQITPKESREITECLFRGFGIRITQIGDRIQCIIQKMRLYL